MSTSRYALSGSAYMPCAARAAAQRRDRKLFYYAEKRKDLSNQDGADAPSIVKSIVFRYIMAYYTASESTLLSPVVSRRPCIVRPPEAW